MPIEGVTFLDHTADVGVDVGADSAADLFHRAALGMLALLRGDDDTDVPPLARAPRPGAATPEAPASGAATDLQAPSAASRDREPALETHSFALDADGWAALLADWLRELLFLHDSAHRDYVRATMGRLDPTGLEARIWTEPAAPSAREIKGVTYHGLRVERSPDGWTGRVIFDV